MRYFITGGAGFIGSNFVEQLLLNTEVNIEKITIFDKLTYAANPKNLEIALQDPRVSLLIGDICNKKTLLEKMTDHDIVVHFAAESHVDRSINSAGPFIETNVLGTLNVLESSLQLGIRTVIHVSTDEVYGSLETGAAYEDFPLLPNSPYAASKASSDLIARSFYKTHGLDVRITRCCNNYGKYQYPEKFIPLTITNAFKNKTIPIYGSGNNSREWIHVNDHCKAIMQVIKLGLGGEIYNIGSGVHFENIELAQKILGIIDRPGSLMKHVTDRKGHDFRYSINSDKIQELGVQKQIDFNRGLKETVEWYIQNLNWWGAF